MSKSIMQQKTITAIATPMGRGGIGVIRLSGKTALSIATQLTRQNSFTPRYATYARFLEADGSCIDEGLVLYFPAPHSFTGEDVIELQGHGGPVVQANLLARLYALGAQAATAGEFSMRAFLNQKMDLAQAEAISDLIDASSTAAARSAVRSLQGAFSAHINQVLEKLIQLRLHVEASIDFTDEEIDFLADERILNLLHSIQSAVAQVQQSAKQGQLLREGLDVVIAGKPNAGKSSLLNSLAGIDRAIVTDIAGTTRDVLHEKITLNGLPITLTDTAGLRDTLDIVEAEGIRRAVKAIEQADLLLLVYDASLDTDPLAIAHSFFAEQVTPKRLMLIANKCDKTGADVGLNLLHDFRHISISAKQNMGLEILIQAICNHADFHPNDETFIARGRHLDALARCGQYLQEANIQLVEFHAGELMAESLRLAQQALSEITGAFTADDLLGKIFSTFCIGK